jgi:hypothetical protein
VAKPSYHTNVAPFFFLEAKHEDIALLFFLADFIPKVIALSFEVLKLQGQGLYLLLA